VAISKEQWERIEKQLSGVFGNIVLEFNDVQLSLVKRLVGENQLAIVVYIDGVVEGLAGIETNNSPFDPIAMQVWRKRQRALWSPAKRAKMLKGLSKKLVKEIIPNIDAVSVWYEPFFPKFAPLKRQYQKLEGLNLIE